MDQVPRTFGILASGAVLVASHVTSYWSTSRGGFGLVEILHFSFPLVIYVFAKLLIDEGRARERASRGQRDQ